MAIAKRNVSVSRGYKPKTMRATKRGPNGFARAALALRQTGREMLDFARDEIADATLDTMQLLDYLRYALRRETRTRVTPVLQELETLAHEHELTNEMSVFAVEQASAFHVGTFKR